MKLWIILITLFCFISAASAQCNFVTGNYSHEMSEPKNIKLIKLEIPESSKFAKNAFKIITSKSENIPLKFKKKFNAIVTAEYNFGTCTYKAKVRQSGDGKDHITLIKGEPLQSLDVKLKDGSIVNTTRFKVLIPMTRQGKNEVLATLILKELGFIAPETFEVNVVVNGVKSVMLFQEKAAKELLERNFRREGPIFEGDESLIWSYQDYKNFELEPLSLARLVNNDWFNKGGISQEISHNAYEILQRSYLIYATTNVNGLNKFAIFPNALTNKTFVNYHSVLLAMNGDHALRPHNRQYYYNAIERGFEPIYYDGNIMLTDIMHKDPFNLNSLLPVDPSKDFINSVLELPNSETLKNKFISRVILDLKNTDFFSNSIDQFQENFVSLMNLVNSKTSKSSYSKSVDHDILWYETFQSQKEINQKLIVEVTLDGSIAVLNLLDGSTIQVSSNQLSKIFSENKLGDQRFVFVPNAKKTVNSTEFNVLNLKEKTIHLALGMDVIVNENNKRIDFIQSEPKDWVLFLHGDYSNWDLRFRGTKSSVSTRQIDKQRFNKFGLTGCLTFYKSIIDNARLDVKKGECEDSINFIRTIGNNVSLTVTDAYADGVDADFSQLSFFDLNVDRVGNDCIDVSRGRYSLRNAELSICPDKAISVGEMSDFSAGYVSINKAEIGVSSKDFSKSFIDKLILNDVSICGEAKRKKQEYGGAILKINQTNLNDD